MTQAEQKFLNALKDVFIGAKVEGQSGFINLMRIKARYFEQGVFPALREDINHALEPFPQFRDELFDKLYNFFHRYFSESGSIYFRHTPLHERVYEQVYTDDRDVMLFWKTQRLYYVKTDRLFQNMEVEVEGQRFAFDVSTLEHKRANEKRSLVYEFAGRRADGVLALTVSYSERGRQTRTDDILRQLREAGVRLSEDALQRAFALFERQSEVDYFINKDAQGFLREQFDLWMYQYIFSGETQWTEMRIRQLQALKDIAYKIIDFIAQFEDELVRIWNKPKFVRNSHYVITLDRIAAQDEGLLRRFLESPGMTAQLAEWRELGMADESFTAEQIWERDLLGERLQRRWQYLPLDTRYFPDLEADLIAAFDHLDQELDGWLIHSENYQALNTMLPKFRERIELIYIDPPFNLEEEADYHYSVNFKNTTWLSLLENRLSLARRALQYDKGSIFLRCNYDGNMLVRLLLDHVFGSQNFRNEIVVRRAEESKGEFVKQFSHMKSMTVNYDNIYWYSRDPEARFTHIAKPISSKRASAHWHSFWKAEDRPNLRYSLLGIDLETEGYGQWMWSKDRALKAVRNYETYLIESASTGESLEAYWVRTGKTLEFIRKEEGNGVSSIKYWIPPREEVIADNNWLDLRGYSNNWGFKTENSERLLNRIIANVSSEQSVVMDFFLGSGTTVAVAHKLRRKWLGIEMGAHFFTHILPRMKQVLFGEQTGISKEVNWKGGGFFKYYALEQYEDVLRRARYEDADLFDDPYRDPYSSYVFLRDLKMLDAVELDAEQDKVHVHLDRLYDGIDVAETLSCVTGRWIRRITADEVEFEDGERVSLRDPDWKLIKPLIWW